MFDPSDLMRRVVSDRLDATVEIVVAPNSPWVRDEDTHSLTCSTKVAGPDRMCEIWEDVYLRFGRDKLSNIVMLVRQCTPFWHEELNKPYERLSAIRVHDGHMRVLNKEEISDSMRGLISKNQIPHEMFT